MKSNNILLIGANGYIASRLYHDLKDEYCIHGCDRFPTIHRDMFAYVKDYDDMLMSDLAKYDTIILLAADSSVKSCEGNFLQSYNNNVNKFVNLLDKIKTIQTVHKHNIKFIYASSSSVYGVGYYGCKEQCKLSDPYNNYDATKQLGDIIALRYIEDIELYGLRFGTVNGASPNMRWDLMINAMYNSAVTKGKINVINPKVQRPILAIYDLVKAIKRILEFDETHHVDDDIDIRRGIYNLCSFNSSVEDIAKEIQKISRNIDIHINYKPAIQVGSVVYDFSIDNSKFCQTFNWSSNYKTMDTQIAHILFDLDKVKEYE